MAEFNKDQTAASRADLDVFLKKTGAQLWIQHDFLGNAKLKKAPAYLRVAYCSGANASRTLPEIAPFRA